MLIVDVLHGRFLNPKFNTIIFLSRVAHVHVHVHVWLGNAVLCVLSLFCFSFYMYNKCTMHVIVVGLIIIIHV